MQDPVEQLETPATVPTPTALEVGRDLPVLEEVDLTGDGGVVKQVLRRGDGEPVPKDNATVTVQYVGTLAEKRDEMFDSSRTREGDGFPFPIGADQVIKAWDIGVASCRVGDLVRLIARSDYAYGERGSPPKIPPNTALCFEVEVISFKRKTTPSEAVAKCLELKDAGNQVFKTGDFSAAMELYRQAVDVFEDRHHHSANEEEAKAISAATLASLSNLCATYIKLQRWDDAVECAEDCLAEDPNSVKALYRRGLAHTALSNFESATQDLGAASKAAPGDVGVAAALRQLKAKQAKHRKAEAAMYKKAFAAVGGMYQERKPAVPDDVSTAANSGDVAADRAQDDAST